MSSNSASSNVQGADARTNQNQFSSNFVGESEFQRIYYAVGVDTKKHEYICTFYRGARMVSQLRSKYPLSQHEIHSVKRSLEKRYNISDGGVL